LLTTELLLQARVFVDISLGLVLFDLGRRLDFNWMRKDRYLLFSGITESLLSFVLIFVALRYFGLPTLFSAVAAAIGISASPAVVMLIAQEQRAEGQVTERALNLVAMNSVIAFITVTMLLSALHFEYHASVVTVLLHPLYLLAGSTLLGVGAWQAALRLGHWLGKREDRQFVLLVALIILTVGLASVLKLSVLLALLVFGVLVKNMDRRHDVLPVEIGSKGQLFFVVLFVVIGAMLEGKQLALGGGLALVYVFARCTGKILGVMPWTMMSGLSRKNAALLGLTLTPMAGFAIVMMQDIWALYPELDNRAFAVVLSAVMILEVLGPLAVQFALRRSGEADTNQRQ
jgi:Kef-type K+ transport system membrane component KefB